MLLKKKLKIFLTYLILISFSLNTVTYGQVEPVKKDDPAPYDGYCLSTEAMSIIVADKEQYESRCNLRVQKQKEMLTAKYSLDIGNLQIKINSIQKEYDQILKIKNKELEQLEQIALKKPNNYWYLFTGGGFIVGVLTTVGIVYAVSR